MGGGGGGQKWNVVDLGGGGGGVIIIQRGVLCTLRPTEITSGAFSSNSIYTMCYVEFAFTCTCITLC